MVANHKPVCNGCLHNNKSATIESSDFYRSISFEQVQGRMRWHPLTSLRKFAIQLREKKFSTDDFVAFLNTKKQYIYEMLLELHDGGYIYYYPEEDSIYVKENIQLCKCLFQSKGLRQYQDDICNRCQTKHNIEYQEL